MLESFLQVEAEICRQGQELAVAWRRGRAAYVLDSLARTHPLRAALLATMIHELLERWDPVEGKWPVSFWRAVLARSEGWLTSEELRELTDLYRQRFGENPPLFPPAQGSGSDGEAVKRNLDDQARRIQRALQRNEPIQRPGRSPRQPVSYLRRTKEAS